VLVVVSLTVSVQRHYVMNFLYLLFFFFFFFFFSSRRRHTRFDCDWSSDVCSSAAVIFPRLPKFRSAALCPTAAAARTPIGAAYPCGFSMNVGELNAGLNYVRDHGSSVATPARVKSRTLRVTIVIP